MADYTKLAATAARLIEANGRSITFRARSGLKNAGQPWLGKAAAASVGTAIGVFTEYDAREIDGSVIRREDRRVLIKAAGLAFTPTTDSEVVDDAKVWQVVNIAELRPGSTAILYDIQVRA